MLMKTICATVIITTSLVIGKAIAFEYKYQLETLESIERCLNIMSNEIKYNNRDYMDILKIILNTDEKTVPLFKYYMDNIQKRKFDDIEMMKTFCESLHIKEEDLRAFFEFMYSPGEIHKDLEYGRIKCYMEKLGNNITKLRNAKDNSTKLSGVLSVSIGVFILIIII